MCLLVVCCPSGVIKIHIRNVCNAIVYSIRGEGLLKEVIEGRMEGKRTRGRPQKGMLDELIGSSYGDMKKRAEGREEWKIWMP